MIVGLPAAGISAVFYLIAAVLMPVVTLWRMARGEAMHPGGWALVARQVAVAAAIIVTVLLTALAIGALLPAAPVDGGGGGEGGAEPALRAVGRIAIWISLGTLALVLIGVRVGAFIVARRDRRG